MRAILTNLVLNFDMTLDERIDKQWMDSKSYLVWDMKHVFLKFQPSGANVNTQGGSGGMGRASRALGRPSTARPGRAGRASVRQDRHVVAGSVPGLCCHVRQMNTARALRPCRITACPSHTTLFQPPKRSAAGAFAEAPIFALVNAIFGRSQIKLKGRRN